MKLAMEWDAKGGFVVQGDAGAAQRLGEGAVILAGLIGKALNAPLVTLRPPRPDPLNVPVLRGIIKRKRGRRGGRA